MTKLSLELDCNVQGMEKAYPERKAFPFSLTVACQRKETVHHETGIITVVEFCGEAGEMKSCIKISNGYHKLLLS